MYYLCGVSPQAGHVMTRRLNAGRCLGVGSASCDAGPTPSQRLAFRERALCNKRLSSVPLGISAVISSESVHFPPHISARDPRGLPRVGIRARRPAQSRSRPAERSHQQRGVNSSEINHLQFIRKHSSGWF